MFDTEFEFDLPKGYIDSSGVLHKHGKMRLATALDEVIPLKDPRVVQNPGYLSLIILARVITSLGDLTTIDIRVIEKLFSVDLAFLQNMYQQINVVEQMENECICPDCGKKYTQPINFTRAE